MAASQNFRIETALEIDDMIDDDNLPLEFRQVLVQLNEEAFDGTRPWSLLGSLLASIFTGSQFGSAEMNRVMANEQHKKFFIAVAKSVLANVFTSPLALIAIFLASILFVLRTMSVIAIFQILPLKAAYFGNSKNLAVQ